MTEMQKTLPKGWKMVRLGEVCKINPSKPELPDESRVTFLPMNSVSDNGEILNPQIKQYKDVQKGYTGFIENDVLFAKITPCMENGKGAIAKNLINSVGFGSTEFHVIRSSQKILPEIIFGYLSLKHIRKFAEANMTGSAGQKRVPQSFLNNLKLPLPPLPTQHKIVEILEEADKLRKLRQQADEKMKDLIPSLFVEMFGDPATNPKGWEVKKLGEVTTIVSGATPRTDNADYWNGKILWVTPADLSNLQTIKIHQTQRQITQKGYNSCSTSMLPVGTVLLSSRAPIGHLAIAGEEMCTNQGFKSLVPKEINSYYLYFTLKLLKNLLIGKGSGATFKEISKTSVERFEMPLPPLPLQQEFAERVEEIEAEKARQAESRKKLDELFNSLMQRAFKGELVG